MISTPKLSLALLLSAMVCAPGAIAGEIQLGWNPVEHEGLAGYRIYYDTQTEMSGTFIEVGPTTQASITGLDDCTTYHVAVKAFDGAGAESAEFSNMVSGWARPEIDSMLPAAIERGSRVFVTLNGANFQPGATVSLGAGNGLTLHGIVVEDCHRITLDLEAASDAALAPPPIEVVNPDQVFGEASGLFAVVADETGPSIEGLSASDVSSTTATIGWQTDEPSDAAVFFRVLGQNTYQPGPQNAAGATSHQVQLTGLVPQTSYEFYARSADAAGNVSLSAVGTFTTGVSPHTFLRFEAESGALAGPLAAVAGSGAFGQAWLEVDSGTAAGTIVDPAGTATYGFLIPQAGQWHLWVRIYAAAADADSWFERVDDGGFAELYADEPGVWQWVRGRSYDLTPGLHRLELGGRDSGTPADRVLITDDPTFVPTEMPGDDVTVPDAVSNLVAAAGDGSVSLSWSNPAEPGLTIVARYRTDGVVPVSPVDGLALFDRSGLPGAADGHVHEGLDNGTSYVYALFAVDSSGNASAVATAAATPAAAPPGSVENLTRMDRR